MTQIDKDTGLPELPVGYYWHVKRSDLWASDYSYITIRRDRLKWGLFTVHDEYLSMICKSHEINTPDRLHRQVFQAWNLYGGDFRKRVTPAGEDFNPYGSYPPKSLRG
jgi:hypothetical protein